MLRSLMNDSAFNDIREVLKGLKVIRIIDFGIVYTW